MTRPTRLVRAPLHGSAALPVDRASPLDFLHQGPRHHELHDGAVEHEEPRKHLSRFLCAFRTRPLYELQNEKNRAMRLVSCHCSLEPGNPFLLNVTLKFGDS